MPNFYAIIPAAGSGLRFGGSIKKQFKTLLNKTALEWTLKKFLKADIFSKIVVSMPPDETKEVKNNFKSQIISFVNGGQTRSESVYKGFCELEGDASDIVIIHDAVRPLLTIDLILKVAHATQEKKAVIPVVPLPDTIKEVQNSQVVKTLEREKLVAVQTPQGFTCDLLKKVYKRNSEYLGKRHTDEAMLIEEMGVPVYTVEGEKSNFKITTVEDFKMAERILREINNQK